MINKSCDSVDHTSTTLVTIIGFNTHGTSLFSPWDLYWRQVEKNRIASAVVGNICYSNVMLAKQDVDCWPSSSSAFIHGNPEFRLHKMIENTMKNSPRYHGWWEIQLSYGSSHGIHTNVNDRWIQYNQCHQYNTKVEHLYTCYAEIMNIIETHRVKILAASNFPGHLQQIFHLKL